MRDVDPLWKLSAGGGGGFGEVFGEALPAALAAFFADALADSAAATASSRTLHASAAFSRFLAAAACKPRPRLCHLGANDLRIVPIGHDG